MVSNLCPENNVNWSAAARRRFRKKNIAKIVWDTEWMKNTPIHVCGKTAFIGWPSTQSRRISSFHTLLSSNHYFRKYFKIMYKNVVTVTLTTFINFLLFRVRGILLTWSACAPTAHNLVRDCRNLRNADIKQCDFIKLFKSVATHYN
jgi:hypothetical protein